MVDPPARKEAVRLLAVEEIEYEDVMIAGGYLIGCGRPGHQGCFRYDDETEVHGRTSAMIKNIPTKLSRTKLVELLDIHCGNENKRVDEQYLGLKSCQEEIYKFDFDWVESGYAFVNFTRSIGAVRFFRCFQNFGWKSFDSRKVHEMKLARRAWLLKLLALELQTGDMTSPTHREMCQNMLSQIFVCDMGESELDLCTSNPLFLRNDADYAEVRSITKTKVLELLDVFLFRYSQFVLNTKYNLQVENILGNPSTSEKGGVYYYSERGDRLIVLASFRERLRQNLRVGGSKYTLPSTPAKNNSPRLATLVKLLEYEVGGAQISIQTAYGVEVEVENNSYDPSLMVFMNIFEETLLASRDTMPFDLLKKKLMSRLETMEQKNLAFGTAASMVHSATDYSVV
ncbi:hypothetical protein GIB67_041665 [Kingdonia uniflora]|uniref:Mei2-like C-terminal RNA recognition motif domain-containing protein n=1 Tax=Kingdonia uniflora TaxID=39325 RepID=A0A7J7MQT5_9MAGN|nr:hypothetical protein GIB67_041665 [Kingdonia uniflora]